jgi:hypothetical protein
MPEINTPFQLSLSIPLFIVVDKPVSDLEQRAGLNLSDVERNARVLLFVISVCSTND